MTFAAGLRETLQSRGNEVPYELDEGYSLEQVLDGHLLAVERMADAELITSVLLLSSDGKRLFHGAGPNLPRSYRAAIDGSPIGPKVGSCGTAAYLGEAVYVTDIATDSLWEDYRHLALAHGLRSCWSTPIRQADGPIIGTFAIYHRTIGGPMPDEIEAIEMITSHVAAAIVQARGVQDLSGPTALPSGEMPLKLVSGEGTPPAAHQSLDGLLLQMEKLQSKAAELDRQAGKGQPEQVNQALKAVAEDCRRLSAAIRRQIGQHKGRSPPST